MLYTTLRILFVVWIIAAIYFAWRTSKRPGFNRRDKWEYVAAFILGLFAGFGAVGSGASYLYNRTCDSVTTLLAKMKEWNAEREREREKGETK